MRGAGAQPGGRDINPRVVNMLAKQQFDLTRSPANGIICYQNEDGDTLDIQADIIGPVQTAYEGGVFRCKLVIESGFPQSAPKGFFLTKIFHPNVAPNTGEICVNTLKRDWQPSKWSLKHIFEVIRCLLIVPFPESSLNEEAGREFMDDYGSFCEHAKVYTQIHAKPNAAQREIIMQRQREEEKLSAEKQQQQQSPAKALPQQVVVVPQRENHSMEDSPNLAQLHQSSRQEASITTPAQKQLLSLAEEESKFEASVGGVVQQQSPHLSMQQARSLAGNQSFTHQQQVLSQVTNSFERSLQTFDPLVKVVRTDDENQMMCQSEEQMTCANGFLPWKQGNSAMVPQQQSLSKQDSLTMADSIVMINSTGAAAAAGGRTSQVPVLQKRPSVLFKKKVETAKQRMERYIRRV